MDATPPPALAAPGSPSPLEDTRSADYLQWALAAADMGTWDWDAHTDLVTACPRTCALWGLGPGPHRWSDMLRQVHPDDRDLTVTRVREAMENRRDYAAEYRVRLPDGSERWISARGRTRGDDAAPSRMHGVVCDVTARKEHDARLERLVREAQECTEELRAVLDSAPIAIWIAHDPECRRITGNAHAEQVLLHVPPHANVSLSAPLAERRGDFSVWRDDRQLAADELPAQRVTRTGEPVRDELLEFRFADGRRVHVLQSAVPLHDRFGRVRGAVAVSADITSLFQAEELLKSEARQLEQLVQQRTASLQESLAEMEAFSYNISHDMRAPLRAMHSFARFLDQEYGSLLPAQGRDYLARILAASARMDRLIQDVLVYSRAARTELKPDRVNLARLVRTMFDAYPHLREAAADFAIADDLPVVLGNDAALLQCFANIVGNALKFVAPGQRAVVQIWAEIAGGRARVFVRDRGIGIPPAAQPHIFDMFYRVNPSYEGSGIGLAVTRKSIERMGGTIGVVSEPGRGSTFHFDLPLAP